MTRSAKVAHAVTGMRKARAVEDDLLVPPSLSFRVFEDNGGAYHWDLVADNGESLVQSAAFASFEEAKLAARIVRVGAGAAPFEQRAGTTAPVDLGARRDAATAKDDYDAERWLDEGGSFRGLRDKDRL